jgi:hypothetical protein
MKLGRRSLFKASLGMPLATSLLNYHVAGLPHPNQVKVTKSRRWGSATLAKAA